MTGITHVGGDTLAIKNLHYRYDASFSMFEDLNIEVAPGEFLAVLGPSGCGKTTLLNLLSGFLRPDSGSVQLRGHAIVPEDSHLGYVFQTPNLLPWLTTIENIEFGLRMSGETASLRRDKAHHYLEMVGLSGFEDYLPARLSGGMQQRASLARTLVMEPHLLLMDEPFAALDAITRESMNDELLRIWDDLGQTVVFITHDVDEAIYLSDRILVLDLPPGGVFREQKIELPRPRAGTETRTSDLFWKYRKELMTHISAVTKDHGESLAENSVRIRTKTPTMDERS